MSRLGGDVTKDVRKTPKIDRGIDRLAQRLRKIGTAAEHEQQHLVCPMAKILHRLDDETGKCLYDVLNDDVTTTTDIIREMRASGIRVARQTIYDYRERVCACAHEDKCGLDERFQN